MRSEFSRFGNGIHGRLLLGVAILLAEMVCFAVVVAIDHDGSLARMAGMHPFLILGALVVVAAGVFLMARILILWRTNVHLRALAEERVGIIDSLIESESHLQSLTDISPVGILFIDVDGICLYANRRAELIAGRSAATIASQVWLTLLHPEDRDRVATVWEKTGSTAAPVLFEARVAADGRTATWILGQAVAQREEHGDVVGYVLTITDITERKNMEEVLAERDARFRASERIARIGHWERSYVTNQVYWSDQVYEIYGLDPATYVPDFDDIYGRMHPDDRERVRSAASKIWDGGNRYDVEHRIVLPDGEPRWVHVQSELIRDEADNPLMFRGTIQDIHEFRETRMALRQSEERFSLAFEASGSGFAISDLQGRYVRVNPAFCDLLGYRMEELLRLGRDDVTHPEELEISQRRTEMLVSGSANAVSREKRYVRKDGGIIWAVTTTVAMADPQDGGTYLISNIQDVTERRQALDALRMSEERFRSAFEASGTGVTITDRRGRYLRVNPAFCRLLRYEEAELLKLCRKDVAVAEDIPNIESVYEELFGRKTEFHSRESRYVRKDGSVLWGIVTSVLVDPADGSDPYLINNLQDITERKEVEEALAQNQERLIRAQRIAELGDWERDVKTDLVTWSPQTPRMLGLENAEAGVSFERFLEVVHPEDREILTSRTHRQHSGEDKSTWEYRIIRADTGEIRYVRSEAEVDRDADGRPLKIAGTLQDVTRLRRTETAFRESEARYRGVFNAGAIGIVVTTRKLGIVEVNKAFEDFVGYPQKDILSKTPLDFVHDQEREEIIKNRDRLYARTVDRIYSERRFIHRDGNVRWANLGVSVLETSGDDPVSIIAVQDITDRKKADEALLRTSKMLDLVREVALASNRAASADELIRFCLKRICEFLGWPVGHAFLIKEKQKDSVIEYSPLWYLADEEKYAPFVELSESVNIRRGVQLPGEVFEKEAVVWREKIPRREHGNGSRGRAVRQVGLKSGVGMPVLAGNDVVAVLEFFSDTPAACDEDIVNAMNQIGTEIGRVFERDRAAKQLLHSEQQMRQIIDNSPLWIYVKDSQGRYVLANEAIASFYDMTASELVGKRQEDVYPYPEITRRIKETDREVVESLQSKIFPEWPIKTRDGDERIMRLVKMPYTMEDGGIGVLGISLDITDEKRAEAELRQAQRMDALGQMTGGVAHDFNNLLTIILGNLQLLQRQIDDPALIKLTAAAERAARRGGDVTGRLLAFARSQPLEPRPVDLPQLVREATPLIERTVGPGVELVVRSAADLKNVLVDPGQIESALINLTANSRDAMPEGGRITIEMENVIVARGNPDNLPLSPGRYVRLAFSDSGLGMDAHVAAHAVEPFFTTKSVGKGSGLGLPSVYGFAEQSGGGVTIESEPGSGTCVSIYLPQSETGVEINESAGDIPIDGRQAIVLLVEDEPDVREYARTILGNLNYRVVEAEDGRQAIAVLKGDQWLDLVFSDVILPGDIDGGAIAEAAGRLRPDLKVILTSGNWDIASSKGASSFDGVAMLSKPYTEEELAGIIRKTLTKRDATLVGE